MIIKINYIQRLYKLIMVRLQRYKYPLGKMGVFSYFKYQNLQMKEIFSLLEELNRLKVH